MVGIGIVAEVTPTLNRDGYDLWLDGEHICAFTYLDDAVREAHRLGETVEVCEPINGGSKALDECPPATEFEENLDKVLAQLRSVMIDRHEKYGPNNITATPFGPEVGIVVRLNDKLARLANLVGTGKGAEAKDESEQDTAVDIAGYGVIYLMIKQGLWPGSEKEGN